jgi:hypothetical protein
MNSSASSAFAAAFRAFAASLCAFAVSLCSFVISDQFFRFQGVASSIIALTVRQQLSCSRIVRRV